ncbi:MAG: hypothetical protein EAX90_11350 [Candidatus Heimdallarchaeota archaeon]|nr:hypothetical protein [Candidatus Heimdallarchaeota archaeon]
MNYIQKGKHKPDALDDEMEIQPFDDVRKESLHRLNYIIDFIKNKKPEIIEKFLLNLMIKLKELVKENFIEKYSIDVKKFYKGMESLEKNPELTKLALNFYFQILQPKEEVNWFSEKTKVATGDYLRSYLLPRYYNVLTLTETINREEAIKLYKQYITYYLIDKYSDKKEERFDKAEAIFEINKNSKNSDSPWVIVCGMLKEGKYLYRNDNCLWVDALTEYPDKELKYLVCCYGDYEGAKGYYNSNFILTMEHTIAQGDKYCSRVIHDTRVDWDLRHPQTEFWDNLKPEE